MENLKYTSQRVSDFATRFCTLLDEKKMNSTEAAKHFGVSKQAISAWRCGDRTPSVMTMQNIPPTSTLIQRGFSATTCQNTLGKKCSARIRKSKML